MSASTAKALASLAPQFQNVLFRWFRRSPNADEERRLLTVLFDSALGPETLLHGFLPYLSAEYTAADRRALCHIIASDQWSAAQHRDFQVARFELTPWLDRPRLDHLSRYLVHALRAVPVRSWPTGPWDPVERRAFGRGDVIPKLAEELAFVVNERPLRERLLHASRTEANQRKKQVRGGSLRAQLVAVTKALHERAPERCTEFLETVHQRLRRYDAERVLVDRKKTASSPIERVVFRGDDGKRIVLLVCVLTSGATGVLVKLKGRYRWEEGDRDDVIGLVPKCWFGAVARADRQVRC